MFLLIHCSCSTTQQPVGEEAVVRKWIAFVADGNTSIPNAIALMSFPFNWDGKMLTRDEAEVKLHDFHSQITAPGVTVTWSDWQTLSNEEFTNMLKSSKHWSKYQKSRTSINTMVIVLSKFARTSPAFENVDGHYFGLNDTGKISAWFN